MPIMFLIVVKSVNHNVESYLSNRVDWSLEDSIADETSSNSSQSSSESSYADSTKLIIESVSISRFKFNDIYVYLIYIHF